MSPAVATWDLNHSTREVPVFRDSGAGANSPVGESGFWGWCWPTDAKSWVLGSLSEGTWNLRAGAGLLVCRAYTYSVLRLVLAQPLLNWLGQCFLGKTTPMTNA